MGNAILFGPATAAALKFVVTLLFFFVLRNAGKAWRDGGALEKRGNTQLKKRNKRKYRWFLVCFIFSPSRTPLTFLPAVGGVGEEEEADAWLDRCWLESTEEGGDEKGGQVDERRGGGEGSNNGGSKVDAASVVVPSPLGLCVVRGGRGKVEEKRVRDRARITS